MNDSLHEPLDRQQQEARDAVRGLPEPVADPDFRARLRADFAAGTLSSPRAAVGRGRPAHGPNALPMRRVRPWARGLVPLAVAASLLLLFTTLNRGPAWELVKAEGEYVEIDGQRVACDDLSPIQALIRPGCEIRVPDGGQLEFVSDGTLYLQFNGGAEGTLPASPGRWISRGIHSRMGGRGTLRVVTAAGFEGASYRIETPDAELVVTGTALAVICGDDELCVCVLEGNVEAELSDGSRENIPAGGRLSVHAGEMHTGQMLPVERSALTELRRKMAEGR